MKLYDYYRSTACYRVRIALELKGIAFDTIEVHLVQDGGEQNSSEYKAINPQSLVPSLEVNGQIITQSLSIIDYLEEIYPQNPLYPTDPLSKACAKSLALIIACDIHPLNNLRVLNQLKQQFKARDSDIMEWYHLWLKNGFDAFESQLTRLARSQSVCIGNTVSLADISLIPQVYNANRFGFSLDNYPLIQEINSYCLSLDAFQKAAPKSES